MKPSPSELTLRELRSTMDVTQVELARRMKMNQSEVSMFETRDDHMVSSVRRYVEALGGKLEVTAVISNRRVRLVAV
jgi:predicted transcriptional regulator